MSLFPFVSQFVHNGRVVTIETKCKTRQWDATLKREYEDRTDCVKKGNVKKVK